MGQDLTTSADLVARTTRRCLEVADELGARFREQTLLPAIREVGGQPPRVSIDPVHRLII